MQQTIDIERWRPKCIPTHVTFLIKLQLETGCVTSHGSDIKIQFREPFERYIFVSNICMCKCMHLVFWILTEDPTSLLKQYVCWFNIISVLLLFLQSCITLWWRSGNCGGRHKITCDVTQIPGGWPCGHLGLGQVKVGSSYIRLRLHRSQRFVAV